MKNNDLYILVEDGAKDMSATDEECLLNRRFEQGWRLKGVRVVSAFDGMFDEYLFPRYYFIKEGYY